MKKLKIAVTGAKGQLGKSLQHWSSNNPSNNEWHFFDSIQLDITNHNKLEGFFKEDWDYLINCAAYTAVDLAESENGKAHQINAQAVKDLAEFCKTLGIVLIHISTDFVFDGSLSRPLKETDLTKAINVYGETKLEGEQHIQKILKEHFILRTGWLYSEFGKNFYKTIYRLGQEKNELRVVCDQIGTPTHTSVLVQGINEIISTQSEAFGIYHLSNEGVASWYDFAYEILKVSKSHCKLNPVLHTSYPTPAKRPAFSVLDKTKFKKEFQLEIPHWKDSFLIGFRDREINR